MLTGGLQGDEIEMVNRRNSVRDKYKSSILILGFLFWNLSAKPIFKRRVAAGVQKLVQPA